MKVVLARVVCAGDNRGRSPFVAGLVFAGPSVVASAPILTFMKGWDGHKVKAHCDHHGWTIERVVTETVDGQYPNIGPKVDAVVSTLLRDAG